MAENSAVSRVLMEADDLERTLTALAGQIHRDFPDDPELVLLGIKTRGIHLAHRLARRLEESHGHKPPVGEIDITLYRDDLSTLGAQAVVGKTDMEFDVTGTNVVLVDDVLYTGRTVRAALNEIVDYGRPRLVRLLVLVDRGLREYPIQAEFVGLKVETKETDVVQVRLAETDGEDAVVLVSQAAG